MKPILAALIVPALAAAAYAADRKVPSQFPTIAAAVAAAQQGDRILVGPGVYQENVVAAVAELQFVGVRAVWDGTLTDGTEGVCLTSTAAGVVVQGFTFRAGASATAQVQLTGDDCRVVKCASRGPATRFLLVTGNRATVDRCRLFAVDSTAIEIDGDDANVSRLFAQQCDDDVVRVNGNRATVTRCKFQDNEDDSSIRVEGSDAHVTGNSFVSCDDAIEVNGDNAVVEGNRLLYTGTIDVTGDGLAIRRNKITWAPNDATGIEARSRSPLGGGEIVDNVLTDIAADGITVSAHNVTVGRNRVTRSGTEGGESACRVSGDGNHLDGVVVASGGAPGFIVEGDSNVLTNCVATDCAADGFHLEGASNKLDGCRAFDCSGEGVDNGGTDSIVTGCTFLRNRLDVANDGTFADFSATNVFKTGGTAQLPQVD